MPNDLTADDVLDAVENKTAGWKNTFRTWSHKLNPKEWSLALALATMPVDASDSVEVESGTTFGALSVEHTVSRLTTTGAATASLPDGYEGQFKTILLDVDGGDLVITPTHAVGFTTITLNDAGDTVTLQFVGGYWRRVSGKGVDSTNTITGTGALGAVSLDTEITLVVTTGAATGTLPAGFEGQRKTIKLKTDGGDYVLTPSSLVTGTTITFNDANDTVFLQFLDGKWAVITNTGATVA